MVGTDPGGANVFDTMREFFVRDDWHYEQAQDLPILRMAFRGKSGRWLCIARARDDAAQMMFYSVLDANVPEETRPAMAEFVARANYGLTIGNFELDFNDGEIRYKTSIDVENNPASLADLIRNLVYINVNTMDKYFPGIMAVMYGGATSTDALAKVEG
jgi:hypothetical protein